MPQQNKQKQTEELPPDLLKEAEELKQKVNKLEKNLEESIKKKTT